MAINVKPKRVVIVHWKKQKQIEVFSNLKNFCLSYPAYNYNTLSNYLSKDKIAFENDTVVVERKEIISKPKAVETGKIIRSIAPVKSRVQMKKSDDSEKDMLYWLEQPVSKRAEAITFLAKQMLKKGERIDKSKVTRIRLKK